MSRRLLLTTDAVGGVWRYSLDLARGLSERGVECVLVVMGPDAGPSQLQEARAVPGLELVRTGLPLDWTVDGPEPLRRACARLATLSALTGVGSAHLHAPALAGLVHWPVPVVAVAHSDVGTWWRAMRYGPPPADLAWRVTATGTGLRAADAVIAPTAAHAAAVQDAYGRELPITVVHNGAVPAEAHAPQDGQRDRAVLTAGRLWDEAKGMAVLDRAAAGLGAPVRAAGPSQGPTGGVIDLPGLVLLGNLDRDGMARAFGSARVFASAARYEPFGLSVLEAAGAGLHLVLLDTPGFRELWDGAARFVAAEAEWPAALRAALDGPDDGRARARAARYTMEATVTGTLAVHDAALARPRRTAAATAQATG